MVEKGSVEFWKFFEIVGAATRNHEEPCKIGGTPQRRAAKIGG